jgi:hypothetical protein
VETGRFWLCRILGTECSCPGGHAWWHHDIWYVFHSRCEQRRLLLQGAPDSGEAKSQTIDTWSYGCVLSVFGTWIVSGCGGVKDFEIVRTDASKRNIKPGKTVTDAFHDGTNVYEEISLWHQRMKRIKRSSDFVTSKILDLVDRSMLLKDPRARLEFKSLCIELDMILAAAKSDLAASGSGAIDDDYRILNSLFRTDQHNRSKKPQQADPESHLLADGSLRAEHRTKRWSTRGKLTASMQSVAYRELTLGRKLNLLHAATPRRLSNAASVEVNRSASNSFADLGVVVSPPTPDRLTPPVLLPQKGKQKADSPQYSPRREGRLKEGAEAKSQTSETHAYEPGKLKRTIPSHVRNDSKRNIEESDSDRPQSGQSVLSTEEDASFNSRASIGTTATDSLTLQRTNHTTDSSLSTSSLVSPGEIWDPLSEERTRSSQRLLDLVLGSHPSATNLVNAKGQTPIAYAIANYKLYFAEKILAHMTDGDIVRRNEQKKTLLHLLIESHRDLYTLHQRDDAQVHKLIIEMCRRAGDKGFVDLEDEHGYTALHLCVMKKGSTLLPTIRALIQEAGASTNTARFPHIFVRAVENDLVEEAKYLFGWVNVARLDRRSITMSREMNKTLKKCGW